MVKLFLRYSGFQERVLDMRSRGANVVFWQQRIEPVTFSEGAQSGGQEKQWL